jgi:hypothetical protein
MKLMVLHLFLLNENAGTYILNNCEKSGCRVLKRKEVEEQEENLSG